MAAGSSRVDLHMHTNISDGTDTPEELLEKVRAAGIKVFSVTDHDAVKAALLIRPLLTEKDPFFLTGAEFSCKDEGGKYHILGYGFDPRHAAVLELIEHGHALRMKKAAARLAYLKSEFGFTFPDEEIARLLSLDNPGKPHIANLMVEHGYAGSKEQAIRDYLNRIRFASEYLGPEEAITGILAGGGIPVLAHPFYGSGDELILGEDMEKRLQYLIGMGLRGVEAFYSGFSLKLRRSALELAEKYELYVTAGSDYHGKNKLVALGDNGFQEASDCPEGLRRFLAFFSCGI